MDPCKKIPPDSEQAHERDLYALEEEVRSKRRSLQSRLFYEHCVQQKKLEKDIAALQEVNNKMEEDFYCQKETLELNNQAFKSRLEMIEQCLEGRKRDLQGTFDAEVRRIKENIESAREQLRKLQEEKPLTDKKLGELQGSGGGSGDKGDEKEESLEKLEKTLLSAKDALSATMAKQKEETEKLRKDLDKSVTEMDDEIINAEDELDGQKEALRAMTTTHENVADDLEYQIRRLGAATLKERDDFDSSVMENDIKRDIVDLKDEIEHHPDDVSRVKQECEELRSKLVKSIAAKAKAQEQDTNADRDGMSKELSDLEGRIQLLEKNETSIPEDFELTKQELTDSQNNKMQRLNEVKSDMAAKHKQRMQEAKENFEANSAHLQTVLQDITTQANKSESEGKEKERNLLDAIAKTEKNIPVLEKKEDDLDIENTKKIGDFIGQIDEVRLQVENFQELIEKNKRLFKTAEAKLEHVCQVFHEKFECMIRTKEAELAKLLSKAEKLDKRLAGRQEKYTEILKQPKNDIALLSQETKQLNEAISKIESAIRDIKESKNSLDSAPWDLEKSANAFDKERARLKKLIEDESKEHKSACEQIQQSIEKAKMSTRDLLKNHEGEVLELGRKLEARKRSADKGRELKRNIKELYVQIKRLDNKMDEIKSHAEQASRMPEDIDTLKREKASLMEKCKKLSKSNTKIEKLETLIKNVDTQVHGFEHDNIPSQVKALLKLELQQLTKMNEKLCYKLDLMNSKYSDVAKVLGSRISYILTTLGSSGERIQSDVDLHTMAAYLRQLMQENDRLRETLHLKRLTDSKKQMWIRDKPPEGFNCTASHFKEILTLHKAQDKNEPERMTGEESVRSLIQRFQNNETQGAEYHNLFRNATNEMYRMCHKKHPTS